MGKVNFFGKIRDEIDRIDKTGGSKRNEILIDGFSDDSCHKAVIGEKNYIVFNSNDYLGLRHHHDLIKADEQATKTFGTGPGAVRFISGTLKIHKELEALIAKFHGRDDAIVFSSAFAANLATIFCLAKGQSKSSLIDSDVFVVSDELNHRSIIDGIRLANLPQENKAIFKHLNMTDLDSVLMNGIGRFSRVVVVTDGVFSMLGEYQKLDQIKKIISKYDDKYAQGIMLIVDDAHGVGVCGETGRGCEQLYKIKADLLVGTLGKAFGADGGYVTGDQLLIDYLRESAATYIYSNSISPGTAGAAIAALNVIQSDEGVSLLEKLNVNITYFKSEAKKSGLDLAANSTHPIQPLLIGSAEKTIMMKKHMFNKGVLVTDIKYPIVPEGRDEIRVQINANHAFEDIDLLIKCFKAQLNI